MRFTQRLVLPTVLALLAAGCGGASASLRDDGPVAQETAGAAGVADAAPAAPAERPRPADDAGGATAEDAGEPGAAAAPRSDGGSGGSNRSDAGAEQHDTDPPVRNGAGSSEAAVPDDPDMDAVDVTAALEPGCVRPGQTITLTATAPPSAGVAYNAFYADGESGAAAPFGAGYGGNDGGMADEQGRYRDTWRVAANAPSGPGHVDVLAGIDGGYGETRVSFAVADPLTGSCD